MDEEMGLARAWANLFMLVLLILLAAPWVARLTGLFLGWFFYWFRTYAVWVMGL